MEILEPELLRVTRAHWVFHGFARALRPGTKGKFYKLSFLERRIFGRFLGSFLALKALLGIIFYCSRVLKQIQGFQVQQISSFWSHSWHGGHWQKILTLLMLYNGPASVLVGSLVAFLMTLLFSLGLLPGFIRDPVNFGHVVSSTWALVSGYVASMVVPTYLYTDMWNRAYCYKEKKHLLRDLVFSLCHVDENFTTQGPVNEVNLFCFSLLSFGLF